MVVSSGGDDDYCSLHFMVTVQYLTDSLIVPDQRAPAACCCSQPAESAGLPLHGDRKQVAEGTALALTSGSNRFQRSFLDTQRFNP